MNDGMSFDVFYIDNYCMLNGRDCICENLKQAFVKCRIGSIFKKIPIVAVRMSQILINTLCM